MRTPANDPDLLLWIHAVEVDSFLLAYRTYAAGLSRADADRYVAEMAPRRRAGRAAARDGAAVGWASCATTCARCAGCDVTPAAVDGLRVVLFPPMHLAYRPLWAIPTTAAIAILPGVRAAACTASRGSRRAALPVRDGGVRAQPGAEPGDSDAAGGAESARASARARRRVTGYDGQ